MRFHSRVSLFDRACCVANTHPRKLRAARCSFQSPEALTDARVFLMGRVRQVYQVAGWSEEPRSRSVSRDFLLNLFLRELYFFCQIRDRPKPMHLGDWLCSDGTSACLTASSDQETPYLGILKALLVCSLACLTRYKTREQPNLDLFFEGRRTDNAMFDTFCRACWTACRLLYSVEGVAKSSYLFINS